jgi:predicted metal-dependent hydrolase
VCVSKKSGQIEARLRPFQGRELDAHYLGYFDCFNRQLFYEAHDVLEELWLADRRGPDGDFYKGLIQLAGAFVHIQKNRRAPAAALFRLARANLEKYPARHRQLDVRVALALLDDWFRRLEAVSEVRTLLANESAPSLSPLETVQVTS